MKITDLIIILDFGSQYTQLIARKLREMNVYCEIYPYNFNLFKYLGEQTNKNLKGVILSGGPSSVFEKKSPQLNKTFLNKLISGNIPLLGLCYGLQSLACFLKGKVHKGSVKEYGHTKIKVLSKSKLFHNVKNHLNVWMSHGDSVTELPEECIVTSKSQNGIISSFENVSKNIYGLQFHPEVNHTESGKKILKNFVFKICKVKNLFTPTSFIESKSKEIRETIGDHYGLCAVSGGVDSTVAAVLLNKCIGKRLICIHVDNGLMRENESSNIIKMLKNNFKINLEFVDASDVFLKKLENVIDPEEKRKIIGKTFIDVFENETKKLNKKYKGIKYLIQGTLYPDVIESTSFKGPSSTIKSHHNVGGLPEKMKLKIIEPFRELFKDEVRNIGKTLKISAAILKRHPFPGPGLAVRIIGSVTKEKLLILRKCDRIYIDALKQSKLYDEIWQAFAVLLPVQTVGVKGDMRSYENVIVLRAVTSTDGMTADFFNFEKEFLAYISNKIINNVNGVNRVVYDISSKPPATIEWE